MVCAGVVNVRVGRGTNCYGQHSSKARMACAAHGQFAGVRLRCPPALLATSHGLASLASNRSSAWLLAMCRTNAPADGL